MAVVAVASGGVGGAAGAPRHGTRGAVCVYVRIFRQSWSWRKGMQPNPREGNFRELVDSLGIPAGRSRTPTSLVPGSGSTAAEPCGECEANEEGRCLLGSMQPGSQMVARSMRVSEGSVWTCEIKPGIRLVPRSNDSSFVYGSECGFARL